MTDNEIINHLASIEPTEFGEAPAVRMKFETVKQIYDLICRQKAEIEKLEVENEQISKAWSEDLQDKLKVIHHQNEELDDLRLGKYGTKSINKAVPVTKAVERYLKAKAYKEFAERLKNIYPLHEGLNMVIDNILKELTERKDENV